MNEFDIRSIIREEIEFNELKRKREELVRLKIDYLHDAVRMDVDYGETMENAGDMQRQMAKFIDNDILKLDKEIKEKDKLG